MNNRWFTYGILCAVSLCTLSLNSVITVPQGRSVNFSELVAQHKPKNVKAFFEEIINSYTYVIVDFFAPWCGPCNKMAPDFHSVASDYSDRKDCVFIKIDVTQFNTLSNAYGVKALPTIVTFSHGKEHGRKRGRLKKSVLNKLVCDVIGGK